MLIWQLLARVLNRPESLIRLVSFFLHIAIHMSHGMSRQTIFVLVDGQTLGVHLGFDFGHAFIPPLLRSCGNDARLHLDLLVVIIVVDWRPILGRNLNLRALMVRLIIGLVVLVPDLVLGQWWCVRLDRLVQVLQLHCHV